jgi:hypothetical protein
MTNPYRTTADVRISPSLTVHSVEALNAERGYVILKLIVHYDSSIAGNVVTLRMTWEQAQKIGLALERAGDTSEDIGEQSL